MAARTRPPLRAGWCTVPLAAVLLTACTAGDSAPQGEGGAERERARNVVVLQGDGMGIAHRELIRLATVGRDGALAMDLDVAGWARTDPADPDDAVTDSAASATAFATGVRTVNTAVGVDPDGEPVESLLEVARDSGRATGLVTTSTVTDGSPAAYAAHVESRFEEDEIARQYVEETRPDVILGGGRRHWNEEAVAAADDNGYVLVEDADELEGAEVDLSEGQRLLGLFADDAMFTGGDGDRAYDPQVPLTRMTQEALDVLSQDEDGFFLFVEEEGIDEFAHHDDAELTLTAGQALDETVQVVVDFAQENPGTLVVVIGDHETGGLALEFADDDSGDDGAEDGPFTVAGTDLEFTVDWTTTEHTGAATPVTASGPGSLGLAKAQASTDVHDAILAAMQG